ALLELERARLLLVLRAFPQARALACGHADGVGGHLDPALTEYALALCSRAEASGGDVLAAMGRLVEVATRRPQSPRVLQSMVPLLPFASAGAKAAARDSAMRTLTLVDIDRAPPALVIAAANVLDVAGEHGFARQTLKDLARDHATD